ncbi:MAG: hypothetical protein ABEI86_11045, partial [Halobacteriaceae archaeon]
MNGIAISLYNKFEELSILVDIVRENWTDEYFISVCSNHPNGKQEIEKRNINIDSYLQGSSINFDPTAMTGVRNQVNNICRVYDTIKKSSEPAFRSPDVNYVMHVHADAWPLSEAKYKNIISKMKDMDKPVAVKGPGLGYRKEFPIGYIMDQFFVVDSVYAKKIDLFEHNPLELLPDRGIHTAWLLILLGKVGWSNVYHYSDQTEQTDWDDNKNAPVRPMMYNPRWELLHLARADFVEDLGKKLQAKYLVDHNLTEGRNIDEFLEKYFYGEEPI